MQAGDFRARAAGGHGQDVGLGLPRGNEHADKVNDQQGAQGGNDHEQDFVGEGRTVEVGGFIEIVGNALEGGEIDEAARPHAGPEHRQHAGKQRRARIVEPADGFGEGGEKQFIHIAICIHIAITIISGGAENFAQGAEGGGGEQEAGGEDEERGFPEMVMQQASGEMDRQRGSGQRQQQPAGGGNGHDQAVHQAGLGRLVEGFPQQDDDESGDGGRQIENQPEEYFSARDFLEEDGESDGRQEGQGDDEEGVAGGRPQRLPPVGVPEEIGEIVQEHPRGVAEDAVVVERHRRAADERNVAPDENRGCRREQQQRHRPEPAEAGYYFIGLTPVFLTSDFRPLTSFFGQEDAHHAVEGEDDGGGEEHEETGGGGASPGEFPGLDDAEHVGVGLAAGVGQQVEQLGAAGAGVVGEASGEGEFLGAPDGNGENVVDDVGVASVGLGAAVGERDGQAVTPFGGDGGGEGVVAVLAQGVGGQEAAEAAFDEMPDADGGGFGGVLEADVFPGGVADERIGDAGEQAHHARIDFGAASGGAEGQRDDAGEVGVEVGEDLLINVGENHPELSAAPLGGDVGGVLERVAAAGSSGGVGPGLGGQAHVEVEGFGGFGGVEDGAPAVFGFVENEGVGAGAPEEGHPEVGLVLAAGKAEGIDAAAGVGDFPAGLVEVLPGPVGGGGGDAGGFEKIAAVQNDASERGAAGHGPDAGVAVGAGAADDGFDLGVDAAGEFPGGERGDVAVFGEVEGMEKALGDIGVGLAEVDIENIGGDVAGDGQQGAFDAFDADAGKAVEAEGEARQVEVAVAPGGGGLAVAEEGGGGGEKGALDGEFGAGGGVGARRVGQIEEGNVQDRAVGRLVEPAGAGGGRDQGGQEKGGGEGGGGVKRAERTPDFPRRGKYFSMAWKTGGNFFHGVENPEHGNQEGAWPGSMDQRMEATICFPVRSWRRERISAAGAPRSSMSQAGWATNTVRTRFSRWAGRVWRAICGPTISGQASVIFVIWTWAPSFMPRRTPSTNSPRGAASASGRGGAGSAMRKRSRSSSHWPLS